MEVPQDLQRRFSELGGYERQADAYNTATIRVVAHYTAPGLGDRAVWDFYILDYLPGTDSYLAVVHGWSTEMALVPLRALERGDEHLYGPATRDPEWTECSYAELKEQIGHLQ